MGLYSILARFLASRKKKEPSFSERLQADPFVFRQLERRRVLDASAAGALLAPLGEMSDTVQAGDNFASEPQGEETEITLPSISMNTGPSNLQLFLPSDVAENGLVELGLIFDDPDLNDSHTVEIDWGDGTPLESINITGTSLLTSHAYLDDNPTGTPADMNQVTVTVIDSYGESVTESTMIEVLNVDPEITFMRVIPESIDEGSFVTLQLAFDDVGSEDSHTVEIDWGDGSGIETILLNSDERSLVTSHAYLDDDPSNTASDDYTVSVTVIDDDTGASDAATDTVTVNNVAPEITFLAVVPDTIDENDGVTLQLAFSDIGSQDSHTVEIDWGDGSGLETILLTVGERSLVTSHTYLDDNPSNTDSDEYTVSVTVKDDDTGVSDTATTMVTVNNVVPVVTLDAVSPIDENGDASLSGTVTDTGSLDTFILEINWGDPLSPEDLQSFNLGTTALTEAADGINWNPLTGEFSLTHQYLDDNPTATASDSYTISATATDDDTGVSDTATTMVTVNNVVPVVTLDAVSPIDENGDASLSGTVTDTGSLDTFILEINWGDPLSPEDLQSFNLGTTALTEAADGINWNPLTGEFSLTHQYLDDNPTATASDSYTISATATDDDTGVSDTATTMVTVNNVVPTVSIDGEPTDSPEGTEINLTSTVIDPGSLDSFTYEWEVTVGGNVVATGTDPTFSFTPADNGTHIVTLTVTDDDTEVGSDSVSINVTNVAPTLDPLPDLTIDEGDFITLPPATFRDPGFDLPAAGTEENFTATIDWGDGTTEPAVDITLVEVPGSAGMLTSGTIQATHAYADNGTYTVTVTVTDDDGLSAIQTFKVNVNNVAPPLDPIDDVFSNEGEFISLPPANFSDPGFDLSAAGTEENFTATVDWGDGTTEPLGDIEIVEVPGGEGVFTTGTIDASHAFADNGIYTVTVTIIDDDGLSTSRQFDVIVSNVDPELTGGEAGPFVLDEGEIFKLSDFGVGLSDPGFTLAAAGTMETFTLVSVDWGDGSTPFAAADLSVFDVMNGDEGVLTTALFDSSSYAYADNGNYTVTLTFADDDGGTTVSTIEVTVNNVAPTLQLTQGMFVINESDTLDLTDPDLANPDDTLATFSDPGFDNPALATQETFSYTIDWGDGTVETGVLPSETISGSQGVLTVGTLLDMHQYVDNDVDGIYTITVTLTDDDGGSVTESFTIQVNNIPPTLDPLIATDVNTSGETILTLTFTDPGQEQLFVEFGDDPFTVLVDWGYMLGDPTMDGFQEEFVYAGDTPNTFVVLHTYTEPPNPASLAADITIQVVIQDDDFMNPAVADNSASNVEIVVISNPGIGDQPIRVDTTAQVPRLSFVRSNVSVTTFQVSTTSEVSGNDSDLRTSSSDAKATTEQILELRVVDQYGNESEGIRLKSEVLNNLPGLFIKLPDNHYVIYLIRQETNSQRLVIEIYLREGQIIDPGDDSDSLRKRPPVEIKSEDEVQPSESSQEPDVSATLQQIRKDIQEELAPEERIILDPVDRSASKSSNNAHLVSVATGLVATRSFGTWARRADKALAQANKKKWRQLRQRNRSQRKNR